MIDSVFSPILAQFQGSDEPIPYADDEPILPKKEIAQALDSREERYSGLLTSVGFASTDIWWKTIEPALEKGDKDFIEKNPWKLSPDFQGLLYGLWADTWDLGCFHAVKGLNIANQQATEEVGIRKSEVGSKDLVPPAAFRLQTSKSANFTDIPLPEYPQQPFYAAYPPNYGYPLRNTDLQAAVEQRTIYLANDVDTKTRDRIAKAVLEAVSQHGEAGIPKRERLKLLAQINLALGRQSLAEIKDPNIPVGEKLVRTQQAVPGTQTFASRAKTIAATEVSAGYSLGRLQVYTQAGVKRVRWQTLEDLRVCGICRTRNGVVFQLDVLLAQHQYAYRHKADPTQYIFPAHPRCRCLPIALNDKKKRDREMISDPGRQPEQRQPSTLRGGWNTLKNAIGLSLTIASAVRTGQRVIQEIQQTQAQREQQEEQQKQEEARRLARSLIIVGGAALSLGLLYMIMRNQQEVGSRKAAGGSKTPVPTSDLLIPTSVRQAASYLTRQQQIQQVKQQPVTPAEILTQSEQQSTLAKLPAGLDLRTISQEAARGLYGLTIAESELVEELRKQYERERITPPEQALVPQFFLPPSLLSQYPGLRAMGNLRDLSLKDLARIILKRGGAITNLAPQQLKGVIQQQIQNVLALPPAVASSPPGQLMVGGTNLNTATVDEIARMLPAGMSLKRRQTIAQAIYNALRRMSQLGTPITSLDELAAVPGVGAITVRNLQSRNYTQNLNNLLLQLGDKDGIDAIAGILDIGSKLAAEIVREFRENGQFGSPGVDPVEDLIDRVSKRVASRRRIAFGEETKNRIRQRLSGRMYVMPIPVTQPVGALPTQIVGTILLPEAISSLDIPATTTPFTPRISGSSPAPQLPPTQGSPPIITPTSSLGFPTRVQSPIQNPVIPVTSAEANQLARRDAALDNYTTLSYQVEDYQSDLTEAVDAGRMPKVGLMGGGLKMHSLRDKLFKQAQATIDKTIATVSGTQVNAAALDQLASSAEAIVSGLESRLQDIDDPLADPLFRNNGELVAEVRNNLRDARSNISRGVGIVDTALSVTDTMQQELQKRKEELGALRSRTEAILNEVDPSAKYQLNASLDSEIARLQALTPEQLGSHYAEVQQLIAQHQDLRSQVLDVNRSNAIESIDGQIAAIDDVIQNASNLQRPELVEYLNQTRERFIATRERINNLPCTFDELTPPQQQQFVEAKALRDRIAATSLNLDRNLSALQKRVDKSRRYLDSTIEAYTNAVTPLQPPGSGSETLHNRERRQGTEYIQNIINLSTQGIDTELQKLRNLADPVAGMSSVLDTIKQTSALTDVPALSSAPVVPGLAVPTSVEPDETIRGRVLDEAVKQRRNLINQSAARITSSATLASGFPYGYTARIQAVTDPTTPNAVAHPEAVTRNRLTTIERLIQELTDTRAQTYSEIQELANTLGADLEQLSTLNPVAYQEIRLSPTWATIQQLRVNAATQVAQYDSRLTTLQQAAAELTQELQSPILHDYRGEQLTAQQISDRIGAVQQEVSNLIKKRRDDLTPIWNKVAPLVTVDSTGLEAAVRGERAPTVDEQDFIGGLTSQEQATLRDAVSTGALDLFRRKVYLSTKERELTSQKAQMWGDPNSPERIRGRQVPKTILKNLELFNRKLRKQAGMQVVLVSNPSEARVDYRVVDLYDELAPNYQAEPGFKDYAGQPNTHKSLQRVSRRLAAQNLIEEFEQAPWVQDTLGMLVEGQTRTIDWRQYVSQIENRQTPSLVPTNYVEVTTALELIKARRVQIEGEMEVVGFKRAQGRFAEFNCRMKRLRKLATLRY